jgi:hypothetical protein
MEQVSPESRRNTLTSLKRIGSMFDNMSDVAECDDVVAIEAPVFWTFDMVEAALIEAHDLWRRSPRAGHAPLKSCWPNEMLQRIDGGDHDGRGGDMIAPEPRPLPLSRAEVAQRDRVSEWLGLIPGEINRRIVVLAVAQLASGRSQVSWRKVQRRLRIERGRGALARRYDRALGAICAGLNYPEVFAMLADGAGPKAIALATGMPFAQAYALIQRLR